MGWQFSQAQTFEELTKAETPEIFTEEINLLTSETSDFDNDGDQDILIIGMDESSTLTASLYENLGERQYSKIEGHSITPMVGDIAFFDIDGDSDLDLLTAGYISSTGYETTLYENTGNGNFIFKADIGGRFNRIDYSDVDNDGDIDFILMGDLRNNINLFINNGLGVFTEDSSNNFPSIFSGSVDFGDTDNDGDEDLLLTGMMDSGLGQIKVANLYENINGNFSKVFESFVPVHASSAEFGDITGNGLLDIFITGSDESNNPSSNLYLNQGSNAFIRSGAFFENLHYGDVKFMDFENDGDLDLVMSGQDSNYKKKLLTYLNLAPNSFQAFEGFPMNQYSFEILDVNEDNYKDILVSKNNSKITTTYYNHADGTFSELYVNDFEGLRNGKIQYVDVNEDGYEDIMVVGENAIRKGKTNLYLNYGNGDFLELAGTPFENLTAGTFDFADVDGDNDEDVLLIGFDGSSGSSISKLFINNGRGVYNEKMSTVFEPVANGNVAFSDFDQDGDQDVLITGMNSDYSQTASFYKNDGTGDYTLDSENSIEALLGMKLVFHDLDNDSDEDLIVSGGNASGKVTKLYLNTSGTFVEDNTTSFEGLDQSSFAFSDIDKDNDEDFIISGSDADNKPVLKMYLNNGDGGFSEYSDVNFENIRNGSLSFADFTGNGFDDLIITGFSSSGILTKLYKNNGDLDFAEITEVPFPALWGSSVSTADFDRNLNIDVAFIGGSGREVLTKVYKNIGTPNLEPTAICKDFTAQLDASGNVTIVPGDINDGSNDAEGAVTLSLDKATFTCDDLGENPVVLTVTDEAGGTATCTATVTVEDNQAPKFILGANGDGSLENPFTSLAAEAVKNASSGTYYFNFNGSTFQGELDNDTAGGGWLMILNYVHQAGTNPNLVVRNTNLPLLGASTLGTSEAGSNTWGHFGNALAAAIDFEEIRFYGESSGHSRVIDFTTNYATAIDYVKTGSGSFSGINNAANYTLLSGHSANIPQNVNETYPNNGDYALTEFPFFTISQYHWGIKGSGSRWEVDDFSNNTNSTIHRVWVRGDLSPAEPADKTEITVELDASGNASVSASDFGISATDCKTVTYSLSQTDFDCSNLGANTIQYIATDEDGNTSEMDVIVNVKDNVVPTAVAKDITVELDDSGNATITTDMVDNGSADNCSNVTLSLDKSTFTCENLGGSSSAVDITSIGSVSQVTNSHGGGYNPNTNEFLYPQWAYYTSNNTVYTFDLDHNSTGSFSLPVDGIMQIWVDKSSDDYYTANWYDNTITRINGSSVDWTYNTTGVARGVTTDANYVYAITINSNTIKVLDKKTGSFVKDITLPGIFYTYGGLVYANGVIYIAGSDDDGITTVPNSYYAIHAFDAESGEYLSSVSTDVIPFNSSFDGENIWISNNSNTIYGYKVSDGNAYGGSGGSNQVVLTVTDDAGNESTATAKVTVVDKKAPVVETKDITVELDETGNASITADMVTVSSSDNCAIQSSVLDMTDFTLDEVGENTVTLTVTDVNGNETITTAVVTIKDVTAPIGYSVSIDQTEIDDTNQTALSFTFTDAEVGTTYNYTIASSGGIDVVRGTGTISTSTDQITGIDVSSLKDGTLTLSVTLTDSSDNTGEAATSAVLKATNTPPTAVCQNFIAELGADGKIMLTAEDIDGGSSDEESAVTLSIEITEAYTCNDIGNHEVTLTVMDSEGETDTCLATVTVVDNLSPQVLVKDITVELNEDGEFNITPDMIDNGSFDNCGVTNLKISRTSFSCENIGPNLEEMAFISSESQPTNYLAGGYNPNTNQFLYPEGLTDQVYVYNNEHELLESFTAPIGEIWQIWMDKSSSDYYTANGNQGVSRISGNTVVWTFDLGIRTVGVTTSKDFVYTIGTNQQTVKVLNKATGAFIKDINLPGKFDSEGGIIYAHGILYITGYDVDEKSELPGTRKAIHAFNPETGDYLGSVSTSENINNVAFDGKNIWISPGSNTIYGYKISDINAYDSSGPNPVVLTVTDEAGNVSTAIANIEVIDNIAPALTAAADQDVVLDTDCSITVPNLVDGSSATDNCTATITQSPEAGTVVSTEHDETVEVVVTATDAAGNIDDSTVVLTAKDTEAPVLTAEENQDVVLDTDCSITVPNLVDGSSATDNCTATITQSPEAGTVVSSEHDGTVDVVVTATDSAGNTAESTVILTAKDETAPVLTAEENQDVVLETDCSITVPNLVDGSSATDNCIATMAQSPVAGTIVSSEHNGTVDVVVTATDAAGNIDESTVVLTAKDMEAPVLTAEENQDVVLDTDCSITVPNLVDGSSATDNCIATITQSPVAGTIVSSEHNGTVDVVVTATDAAGNIDESTVVLTAKDTEAPVFTAEENQDVVLDTNCSITVPDLVDGSAATDNCTATITQSPETGTVVSSEHDGTIDVVVTATDAGGNIAESTVVLTAKDVTAPVLTAEENQDVNLDEFCSITVPDLRGTATDNCTATITQSPEAGTLVSSEHNGTVDVVVTATDAAGNKDEANVVLTAKDITAPVLTAEADQDINLDANCAITVPNLVDGSSATDNCTATITQSPEAGTLVSSEHDGTVYVVVTATDAAGNTAESTVVLTTKDVTAPVLMAEENQDVNLDEFCSITVPDLRGTATDNCTATITQSPEAGTLVSSEHNGTVDVVVTATDAAGNKDEANVVLTAKDETAPVAVMDDLEVITAECMVEEADVAKPLAVDNCEETIEGKADIYFPITRKGSTIITWTFEDASGNKTYQQQEVIIEDNTAPVADLSELEDLVVECEISEITAPTATDNCKGTVVGVTQDATSYTEQGEYTITWTYDDGNGNITTQEQHVIVNDVTAPEVITRDITVYLDPDDNVTITPEDLDNGTIDNCSNVSLSLDRNYFDETGEYEVVLTATDAFGNMAEGTAIVTVEMDAVETTEVHVVPTILKQSSQAKVIVPFRSKIIEVQILESETGKYKLIRGNKLNEQEIDIAPFKGTLLVRVIDQDGTVHLKKLIAL